MPRGLFANKVIFLSLEIFHNLDDKLSIFFDFLKYLYALFQNSKICFNY